MAVYEVQHPRWGSNLANQTNRRTPKSITHQCVTYSATRGGQYQSSDGSILPDLLVTYLLLSSNEQQAFAAQNPEVQSLLGDTTQDAAVADGASTDSQTSADGANYGDGGDHSGGADFGGSDTDGGDTSGGDSGGDGGGGGGGD